MKLIQKSNFRVQGFFLSKIVLRKTKTRHTLKKALLNHPLPHPFWRRPPSLTEPYPTFEMIKSSFTFISEESRSQESAVLQKLYNVLGHCHTV